MAPTSVERRGVANIYDAPSSPQQLASMLGCDVGTLVKLDANENPYGPPPGVLEAVSRVSANRYPDAQGNALKEALSSYLDCSPERLVLGNGSDELIDLICRTLLAPGDEVVVCPPTFSVYSLAARQAGASIKEVWRDEKDEFAFAMDRVLNAVGERTKIIFLCSPDNPTGREIPEDDLRSVLELGCLVVLDEAYAEFAGGSYLHLTRKYSNLVVLRTFSKAFGLAGLRIGYGVFPPALPARLEQSRLPYNVNAAAQAAALVALQQMDWVRQHVELIRTERQRMLADLKEIEGLEPRRSAGNFLLVCIIGRPAREVHSGLLAEGIMVRRFSQPPLDRYLRITVGTPEQNSAVLASLRTLLSMERRQE